jgi:hypothetical protein
MVDNVRLIAYRQPTGTLHTQCSRGICKPTKIEKVFFTDFNKKIKTIPWWSTSLTSIFHTIRLFFSNIVFIKLNEIYEKVFLSHFFRTTVEAKDFLYVSVYDARYIILYTTYILYIIYSAKHSVKDGFAFLWEHAIFRHLPDKNPLTDRSEILHSWLCRRDHYTVKNGFNRLARGDSPYRRNISIYTLPYLTLPYLFS